MRTPSERLALKVDLLAAGYGTPGRLLLEHPRAREICPQYLATGAYVSLAMVPLMEAALARAREIAPLDAVAAGLVDYLEHHIPEEMHGDEPGGEILEDLAVLGLDTDALRSQRVPTPIAALIGSQFLRIRHAHPVCVLGFLWLEEHPPNRESVERLIEVTGLPREGFRQLLVHSEVDVRHGAELRALMDSLPLEARHEELIGLSALETMGFLIEGWLEVLETPRAGADASRLVGAA